jgi:hypothetical protein
MRMWDCPQCGQRLMPRSRVTCWDCGAPRPPLFPWWRPLAVSIAGSSGVIGSVKLGILLWGEEGFRAVMYLLAVCVGVGFLEGLIEGFRRGWKSGRTE